jgi:hypothetical protein
MVNVGVPQGGKYPSRQELSALLRPFLQDASDLQVDRRTSFGKQFGRVYSDTLAERDENAGLVGSGKFYNPQSYDIAQTVDDKTVQAAGGDQSAFSRNIVQWDVPTSSTNYSRPRTVAAGYSANAEDPNKGVMTVVFRDGTFYNYYEVSPTEWEAFHASYSKGRPWLNRANKNQAGDGLFVGKPRGDAGDMGTVDPQIREALYRVSRTFQQKTAPKRGRTTQQAPLYQNGGRSGSMTAQNRVRADKPRNSAKSTTVRNVTPSSRGNRKAS